MNVISNRSLKKIFTLLKNNIYELKSPISMNIRDYIVEPTSNDCIMRIDYDLSDLIPDGYIAWYIYPKILYTSSHSYQQVNITNCFEIKGSMFIMCETNVPFKMRIHVFSYRKSVIL